MIARQGFQARCSLAAGSPNSAAKLKTSCKTQIKRNLFAEFNGHFILSFDLDAQSKRCGYL
jgi:hypothetical protein